MNQKFLKYYVVILIITMLFPLAGYGFQDHGEDLKLTSTGPAAAISIKRTVKKLVYGSYPDSCANAISVVEDPSITVSDSISTITETTRNIDYDNELTFTSGQYPWGFYSNALMDALLVPNIGLEFYFLHHYSAALNYHHSWWQFGHGASNRWKTYGFDLSLGYWLGNQDFTYRKGHRFGVFGQAFTYDFSNSHKGEIADAHHWNWMAGGEYGYRLNLCSTVSVDFSIGIGYWGGIYQTYQALDNHAVWTGTKRRQYFGICKAGISIVWTPWTHAQKGGVK